MGKLFRMRSLMDVHYTHLPIDDGHSHLAPRYSVWVRDNWPQPNIPNFTTRNNRKAKTSKSWLKVEIYPRYLQTMVSRYLIDIYWLKLLIVDDEGVSKISSRR